MTATEPPSLEQRELDDAFSELTVLEKQSEHAGLVRVLRLCLRLAEITTYSLRDIKGIVYAAATASAAAAASAASAASAAAAASAASIAHNNSRSPFEPWLHLATRTGGWVVVTMGILLTIWKFKGWL